jgi:uncharacterized protein (TIRG00374 family)
VRLRDYFIGLGKFLVSGGLIYLLYRKTPVDQILGLLAEIDLRWLAPIALLMFSNTVVSAWKWSLFLKADGVVIPLKSLVVTYLIGSFYNMFLPSNIGGDSYRIYDVARKSNQTMRSAVSVLADRVSGFIAMISVALVSALFVGSDFGTPLFFLLPLLILISMVGGVYMLFKKKPVLFLLRISRLDRLAFVRSLVDKLLLSVEQYGNDKGLLVRIMLLSYAFQFSVFVIVYLLARSLHAELPFIYFCSFVPMIALLEVLPISINGIGLRDAGYVLLFGWAGLTEIQTRSLALLFLAVSVFYSCIGGLAYLGRIMTGPKKESQDS